MALPLLVSTLLPRLVPFLLEYLEWSREAPRPLADREIRLHALFVALAGVLLQADAEADEACVRPPACACGGRFQSKGRRPRTLATTVGEVTYRRRYYECSCCHSHAVPVDAAWEVGRGVLSPHAATFAVALSSALPFREAHHWLGRLGRVTVSLSTLWRATQRAGAAAVAEWEAHRAETRTRAGAACWLARLREPGASGRWAIGVDGLFLRIERQWREVKVAVIAPVSATGRWVKGRMSYTASVEGAETFRQQVVWHARSRGVTRRTVLAIVGDGAAWIGALARRHFPQAIEIRDFWHVVEYLWQAAHAAYGEGNPAAARTVERWCHRLKRGKVAVIRRHLGWIRRHHRIGGAEAKKAYRQAEGYLEGHAGAMAYDRYAADHWPLGSGPAEATCKLMQVRMKRSGANWSSKGAQHMLFLRADYCSHLCATLYPQS